MNTCKLCQKTRQLCQSHIIPEFLYKPLYNQNRKIMGITGTGHKGWKNLQKGVRERLLCQDCEALINLKYEIPFQHEWYKKNQLPRSITKPATLNYSYSALKLFHLSIIYRASISSLPCFKSVDLGHHEQNIQKMLLTGSPQDEDTYPITGLAVINSKGLIEDRLITMPKLFKISGHHIYQIMYAGVMWHTIISSHKFNEIKDIQLKENGDLFLPPIPWHELSVMQDAKQALTTRK